MNKKSNIGRLFVLFTILVMLLQMLPVGFSMSTCLAKPDKSGDFAAGSGSEGDPWQITTPDHLNSVRNYLDKHFILMSDIDLTETVWGATYANEYSTAGWEPIGKDENNYFSGTFDGNKHSISGLYINRPETDNVGMFGYTVAGSDIKNVRLENVNVTGQNQVGGLVGFNQGCITASIAIGEVTGNWTIGGLAGKNYDSGTITDSYASVTAESSANTGGLVGTNTGNITNSYAAGDVVRGDSAGGLVGGNEHGSITNCYATCYVEGGRESGGLVGYNLGDGITGSYYDSQTTQSDTGTGIPKTTTEMKNKDTFEGWDFDNTWTIIDTQTNSSYPYLKIMDNWIINDDEDAPGYGVKEHIIEIDGHTYTYTVEGETANITGFTRGSSTEVEIPGTINGKAVTMIEDYAFSNKGLTQLTIPGSIESIGERAFASNVLENLTISNGVEIIGEMAFYGNKLTTVEIPASVKSIGQEAFADNEIENLTISDGVEIIGVEAFYGNEIISLEIPASVKNIGESAFYGNCLQNLTILEGVETIDSMAFVDNNLTTIKIPASVTSIGMGAFAMNKITSVSILNSTTTISEKAFFMNTNDLTIHGHEGSTAADYASSNDHTFEVLQMSDAEAVEAAAEALSIADITFAPGEDKDSVIGNLTLPASGENDTIISWSSDNTDVLTNDGTVTRPAFGNGDVTVILTATIAKGDTEVTKTFNITVIQQEEAPTYTVTYEGNGNTGGSVPVDNDSYAQGVNVTILGNTGNLVRTGYTFAGWNTKSDGSGTDYAAGSTFTMGTADVTLYAKWTTRTSGRNSSPRQTERPTLVEQVTVNVETGEGENNTVISTVTVQRTTAPDGTIRDQVDYSPEQARETVDRTLAVEQNTARIILPDEQDEVAEVRVNIPRESVQTIADGQINMEIATEHARIWIPNDSLQDTADDLFFRVVPVREEEQRQEIETRAAVQTVVVQAAGSGEVEVVGRPMTIETNMGDRAATIVLPLKDMQLPEEPHEREHFLANLAVFIEHSDGEQTLIRGRIVEYGEDGTYGIEFDINKFSTFTILHLPESQTILLTIDELQAEVDSRPYTLDAAPFVKPELNRTMVPLRFVSEALGAEVNWHAETRQVVIKNGVEIVLTIQSNQALIDGTPTALEAPAELVVPPGRVFVPLRFVSETLGATVDYEPAGKRINIKR